MTFNSNVAPFSQSDISSPRLRDLHSPKNIKLKSEIEEEFSDSSVNEYSLNNLVAENQNRRKKLKNLRIKKEAASILTRPASRKQTPLNESDSYQVFDNFLFHLEKFSQRNAEKMFSFRRRCPSC